MNKYYVSNGFDENIDQFSVFAIIKELTTSFTANSIAINLGK